MHKLTYPFPLIRHPFPIRSGDSSSSYEIGTDDSYTSTCLAANGFSSILVSAEIFLPRRTARRRGDKPSGVPYVLPIRLSIASRVDPVQAKDYFGPGPLFASPPVVYSCGIIKPTFVV